MTERKADVEKGRLGPYGNVISGVALGLARHEQADERLLDSPGLGDAVRVDDKNAKQVEERWRTWQSFG